MFQYQHLAVFRSVFLEKAIHFLEINSCEPFFPGEHFRKSSKIITRL